MADGNSNRPLSEISHLFLSSVRDLPRPGAPRPMRIPPGGPRLESPAPRPQESIDLTPEEFAEVYGEIDLDDDETAAAKPTVIAVLASHLGTSQATRIRQYARHCATRDAARIGLIEVDASELRISRFEPGCEAGEALAPIDGTIDAATLSQVLVELNADVDRWLLLVADGLPAGGRKLISAIPQWTLLCTCDHDGVVSGYRTLKGLADLHRPKLTLALLDVPSVAEGAMVHRKLGSVCEQFLRWPLEREPDVESSADASESLVLHQMAPREMNLESPTHWAVLQDWLGDAPDKQAMCDLDAEASFDEPQTPAEPMMSIAAAIPELKKTGPTRPVEKMPLATDRTAAMPLESSSPVRRLNATMPAAGSDHGKSPASASSTQTAAASPARAGARDSRVAEQSNQAETSNADIASSPFRMSSVPPVAAASSTVLQSSVMSLDAEVPTDVVDLPGGDLSPAAMLSAIVRHQPGMLVECPVRPPMCPGALLAVDRDHGIVLLAVAQSGLADLRQIAMAYQWMNQNRALLAMAMPQFNIDGHRLPQLRLLVDHRDMTANLLQPMLAVGHVLVQAYRKLRWSGKIGLLLEAA